MEKNKCTCNKKEENKEHECCKKEQHHCCYSKENELETKHCCHNKENNEDHCCHHNKEVEHHCCHNQIDDSTKLENSEHTCCCHNKEEKTEHHCCCHHNGGNSEHHCCHSHDNVEYDCCGNKIIKPEVDYDCCGNKIVKPGKSDSSKKDIKRKIIFLCISLVMLILSYINIWKLVGLENIDYLDFGYVAIALCGYPIFVNAFRGLRHKKINSSLLVSTAIVASVTLEIICRTTSVMSSSHSHSYVFAAGEISFLMALGSLIESYTIKSSRKGIENLMAMTPKTANLKFGNEIKVVNIEDINVNDIVVVKPNEMIPVDGIVISGNSAVDQSNITGEFLPVDVKEDSKVYAGTFNKMGVIEIVTSKKTQDNTVNKLVHLALEAEENKAPIVRVADKWASYIVPGAVLLSLLVGIVSYFAFDLTVIDAIIRGVTILVVFCPCSLTLAAPTAVAAGIGSGANNGIIVKSGEALEKLASVDTIAFDKTGTITSGNIKVMEVFNFTKDLDVLKLTASIEKYSEHPIGKAIVEYSKENKVELIEPKDTISNIGVGISAFINKDKVETISYNSALNKFKDDTNLIKLKDSLIKGYTVIVTLVNDKLVGAISLYDTIRPNAEFVMETINSNNIDTLMLTGDGINSAKNIADICNIKTVKANLMPEDKLKVIKELKDNNHSVCMVGDGVNDAPALASSSCSIAMTSIGNDIAIETSDIAIMNKDITNVVNALNLSKKTLKTIKRNIVISMTINACAVIVSLLGYLTPITGAIVHNCTSVFVVASSALILRTKYIKNDKLTENK